jgi:hypothetical protein
MSRAWITRIARGTHIAVDQGAQEVTLSARNRRVLRRYGFTILFNINNKQLLGMWMYPLTATTVQFFVGGCLGILWFIATGRRPVLKPSVLKSVFPLATVRSCPRLPFTPLEDPQTRG